MRRGRWIGCVAVTVLVASLLATPQPGLTQGERPGSQVGAMQAPLLTLVRITDNSVNDLGPVTAYNTRRQEYFVVWTKSTSCCTWGIYGRRVDLNGNLVGGTITIDGVGFKWHPAVAYNSAADEYLVVYDEVTLFDEDVYARPVSGDGVVGDLTPVDTTSPTLQSRPSVAYNGQDNNYLIVYESETGGATDKYLIRGQVRAADMGVLVASKTIASGVLSLGRPDVDYDRTRNQYLVVYERRYLSAGHYHGDILGRLVSNNLGSVDGELQICTDSTRDQYAPAVAAGPDEFLVVWSDGQGDSPPANYDIYGSRVGGDGSLPGAPSNRGFAIASSGTNNRFWPDVAYGKGWGYFVAWQVDDGTDTGGDIWGSHWMAGENRPAGEEFVLDNYFNAQYYPVVACQPVGDCFFADEDWSWTGTTAEIDGWLVRLEKAYLPVTMR